MNERKFWGFSEVLGPVIRRRFPGTEEAAQQQAQLYANRRNTEVDYWDEDDEHFKSHDYNGKKAASLRTVAPQFNKSESD